MELFNKDFQKKLVRRKVMWFSLFMVITLTGYFLAEQCCLSLQIPFLIIMMGLYGIMSLLNYLKHYNYLFFSIDDKRLIVRYFRLGFLGGKQRNEIIIPLSQFKTFEIKPVLGGWRNELTLFQRTSRGISKYKPISIEALSTEDKHTLDTMLTRIRK